MRTVVAPGRSEARPARRARPTGVALALLGPTATGKTEAALELAPRLDAEIVACDSMTVYRGMDVGTAGPGPAERAAVPHHLLGVAASSEPFTVAVYQRMARDAIAGIVDRGRRALLVGGSGLYFRAAVDDLEFPGTDPRLRRALGAEGRALGPARLHARLADLDPEAAAKIDPENLRRTVRALEVPALTGRLFSSFAGGWDAYPADRVRAAGVRMPADLLYPRIEARVERMYRDGLLEEARALVEAGQEPLPTASQAIGYLEAIRHLRDGLPLEDAKRETVRRTKALARRQMAWFRRDPRIRWFDVGRDGAAERTAAIEAYLLGG